MIGSPQPPDFDAEQGVHVVVSHVLEVEPRPGIPMDGALPVRLVVGVEVGTKIFGDRHPLRRNGERQPFADEPQAGTPEVLEREEVDADTEVVADSDISLERQVASARRRADVLEAGGLSGHQFGKDLVDQRRPPAIARKAEHRRLLFDLLATAEHSETGMACHVVQQGRHLGCDDGSEGLVVGWVDRAEHDLLPDQQPGTVARIEEPLLLIQGVARYPEHVHPGSAGQIDGGSQVLVSGLETYWFRWIPSCPTTEDRDTVDHQSEATVRPVHLDGPEADLAEVDVLPCDHGPDAIQGLVAMGVGPPPLHIFDHDRAEQPPPWAVADLLHRHTHPGHLELCIHRRRLGGQPAPVHL